MAQIQDQDVLRLMEQFQGQDDLPLMEQFLGRDDLPLMEQFLGRDDLQGFPDLSSFLCCWKKLSDLGWVQFHQSLDDLTP